MCLAALEPLDHGVDPLGLLGPGERRRDEDDDRVAVAIGRDGAAAPARTAYFDRLVGGARVGSGGHGSTLLAAGDSPGEQPLPVPGVDDPVGVDARALGPLAPVAEQVELAGRVCVGVDREQATQVTGELEERGRRVAPLRSGVDLHGDTVLGTRYRRRCGRRTGSADGCPGCP